MRALALAVAALASTFTACVAAQEPPPVTEIPVPIQDPNEVRQSAFAAERAGEHGKAADAFLELAKLEPTEPNWIVHAADNLGRAGRVDEALDLLPPARKRFPDALALPSMLARSFALKADRMRMESGRTSTVQLYYEDAARTAREVLAIDPRQMDSRLVLASALLELGEPAEAETVAREAVKQAPRSYSTNALLGRIAYERFVTVRGVLDSMPEGVEREAVRTVVGEMHATAKDAFVAASEADPDRSFPLNSLGDLAAWDGDLPDAMQRYGDALAVDPWAKTNHAWIRTAYDATQRATLYGGARTRYAARADARPAGTATLAWYEAQAAFDSASGEGISTEARTAAWKKAGDFFESTLGPLPDYIDTYWWLMQSRYWQGDVAGATKAATTFATRQPRRFADMVRDDEDAIAILVGIAAEEYAAGRIVQSRDVNLVIAYARSTADAWNNYAFLCRETRAYQDSLTGYERALGIEPDSPQLLNDCAVILQYNLRSPENRERAKGMYERAIELAQTQLAAGGLSADQKERVTTALRDARNNLTALDRGR